ncbi:MAG: hypothetical protein AAF529_24110, partial [Pseudomonadota bacterium]
NSISKSRQRKPDLEQLAARQAASAFRAVSIYSPANSCDGAARIRDQRFLARHAPQLPLENCSHPQQCRCRYRHHQDRRDAEARRDADHGLPSSPPNGDERRRRDDRRRGGPRLQNKRISA